MCPGQSWLFWIPTKSASWKRYFGIYKIYLNLLIKNNFKVFFKRIDLEETDETDAENRKKKIVKYINIKIQNGRKKLKEIEKEPEQEYVETDPYFA